MSRTLVTLFIVYAKLPLAPPTGRPWQVQVTTFNFGFIGGAIAKRVVI